MEDAGDPRMGSAALHEFDELLKTAFCAVPGGSHSAVDMAQFPKAREPFRRGLLWLATPLPGHDTFGRRSRRLGPTRLQAVLRRHAGVFRLLTAVRSTR
jgi:hypothetical protein